MITMGLFDKLFRKSTKGPLKKKKKNINGPYNTNPFIKEVSMKGIKLHSSVINLLVTPFMKSFNIIIPFLDKRPYYHDNPSLSQKADGLWADLGNGNEGTNPYFLILSSLDMEWPEEIECPACEEGTVPQCPDCDEGYMVCENCGGNWEQDCAECGGAGRWDCDECNAGQVPCEDCKEGQSPPDCNSCDGGEAECQQCQGIGTIQWCEVCGAEGTCGACDGEGKIFVGEVDGEEEWEDCEECEEGVCPECEGTPQSDCDECGGRTLQTCDVCEGTGNEVCESCEGTNWVDCDDCEGEGGFYCDYCEGGVWYCQECDEGSWECNACRGNWVEHLCEGCEGEGMWNSQNSEKFGKLINTLNTPLSIEEKITNLVQTLPLMASESIYVPPKWSEKKHSIAMEKIEFVKNIKLKTHYYDAFDFNFKNLYLNSYSLLIVPNEKGYTFYTINSTKVGGTEEYPTYSRTISKIPPIQQSHYQNVIKNKNDYGDYVNFSYLKSPPYNERKVILLRSNWYYNIPSFLNWMEDTELLGKD